MNLVATFEKGLKKTLRKAITDKDVTMKGTRAAQIFDMPSMSEAYETFQIWGGIGPADEQTEGANITIGTVNEGPAFTFYARKFGKKIVFSEEAIEDMQYKNILKGAKFCTRSVVKAAEDEAALIFDEAFDTARSYGNGQPLCSASHPLPDGSTFSNLFSVSMAPSVQAFSQARQMARQFPSYDGTTEGVSLKGVICPVEQESEWEVVLKSKLNVDDPGNFSQINVAQRANLKLTVNEYLTASATANWFQTDAMDGLMFMMRRKLRTRSWVGNDQETVCFAATVRWALGHANPRCVIGNQGL